jgi:hypothetical protein
MSAFIDMKSVMSNTAATSYYLSSDHVIHVEDACDSAAWDSWNERGGDYHDRPSFSYTGTNYRKVTYTVNIDGKQRAPCFTEADRVNAESAGHAQAAICQAEQQGGW